MTEVAREIRIGVGCDSDRPPFPVGSKRVGSRIGARSESDRGSFRVGWRPLPSRIGTVRDSGPWCFRVGSDQVVSRIRARCDSDRWVTGFGSIGRMIRIHLRWLWYGGADVSGHRAAKPSRRDAVATRLLGGRCSRSPRLLARDERGRRLGGRLLFGSARRARFGWRRFLGLHERLPDALLQVVAWHVDADLRSIRDVLRQLRPRVARRHGLDEFESPGCNAVDERRVISRASLAPLKRDPVGSRISQLQSSGDLDDLFVPANRARLIWWACSLGCGSRCLLER